tara:strand:+ start:57 stop:686 length:630 start_codon:yes stop_codon:yes gene_type:complete
MKLNIERIFPTSLYVFDDVLEPEYIDSMREDIIKSGKINAEQRQTNWQSVKNNKLYELPKYKELGKMALNACIKYIDLLEYKLDDIELTGMWSNILKPGETHPPHTHSNNFISGVYYVQADNKPNTPAINFLDPRGQTCVLQPQQKRYNIYNSTRHSLPAKINRMILFPSWLSHFVPINYSKSDRISIAFNAMLKGKVGEPTNFQSANF